MSKLSQLQILQEKRLPTPRFVGISWEAFQSGKAEGQTHKLKFPVAVRSTYSEEDGDSQSFAGAFHTELNVSPEQLSQAISQVFDSYPEQKGQQVIVQEMVKARYSGVLFAYRQGVWKLEYVKGSEEKVVDGKSEPQSLLLPQFGRADILVSHVLSIWQPYPSRLTPPGLVKPLIHLSSYAGRLLAAFEKEAKHGLDVEFAIAKGKAYVLQARPITTPEDAEEVLTSANHKEILPPKPSQMMTAVIDSCSRHLFSYYRKLDPTLPDRRFIEVSGNMPWINLSALLETMIKWGLPTSLVCESVGAEDVYNVKLRPHRWLRKWPIFLKVLRDQFATVGRVRRWVRQTQRYLLTAQDARRLMWRNQPELALDNWLTDMQLVYTELVTLMQALTGSMSGPVKILAKLGLLHRLRERSESTRYMEAYKLLAEGKLSKAEFIREYGHRGFYESDIGQLRFSEYTDADWAALLGPNWERGEPTVQIARRQMPKGNFLVRPFLRMIHTREWLRNHSMRYFALLREEIREATRDRLGQDFDFSKYTPEDLHQMLKANLSPEEVPAPAYPEPQGWEPDTFLRNRLDRQMPVSYLSNLRHTAEEASFDPIGLYPGKVRGQVWRVRQADMHSLNRPEFETTILLTESLDPGWIPYFVQVEGVVSRVGGILSHASIILRESRIPAITRFDGIDQFETGDWIEIDGKTGEVVRV